MDYKEKYEQALENIKKIKAANKDNKELVDFIEYRYPELKESEEDEKKIMWLIRLISTAGYRELETDKMPCSRSELLNWLKSLKDRVQPQPKQEWSEEDEKLINEVADSLRKYSNYVQGGNSKVYILSLADSIESLQPRYAWLPSDKQMQELYNLVCDCRPADTQLLQDIYYGLKSLKEINKV